MLLLPKFSLCSSPSSTALLNFKSSFASLFLLQTDVFKSLCFLFRFYVLHYAFGLRKFLHMFFLIFDFISLPEGCKIKTKFAEKEILTYRFPCVFQFKILPYFLSIAANILFKVLHNLSVLRVR